VIPRKTRTGIFLLAALTLLTFWAVRRGDNGREPQPAEIDTGLEYALTNFQLQYFDEQGVSTLTLRSPYFRSEIASGEGQAEHPRLEIHHRGFVWHIIADSARVPEDQELVFLTGAVHLERSGNRAGDWMEIDTRDVTVEVTPRIARSEHPVNLRDPSGRLAAEGFEVNMIDNTYRLSGNVRGVYATP